MSSPSMTTLPLVISSRRFKHLKKVDLPDPEGPIKQITSPSLISKEISFKTSKEPKFFFKFLTETFLFAIR